MSKTEKGIFLKSMKVVEEGSTQRGMLSLGENP